MTFATKVKSEISHNKGLIGRNKKAFSYGMMLCGKSFSQQSISMTTENKYIAKLYANLIFQQIPMQTSVTTRNRPGMTMSHQLLDKSARSAWLSMLPQDTVSIGRPMPRKLSVDSVPMAEPMFVTTINMMEETKFGSRWRRKM